MEEVKATWWYSLWEFAVHVFIGVIVFSIVTTGAIGVHYIVSWAKGHQLHAIIVQALEIAEYVVFAGDILIFLIFIFKTTWKALRTI